MHSIMSTKQTVAGVDAFNNPNIGWWTGQDIHGNWNCVCNSGLTLGALAILGDDDTKTVEQILGLTVPNALQSCAHAVSSDCTWAETVNYWYSHPALGIQLEYQHVRSLE